jgi:hypothetical protein
MEHRRMAWAACLVAISTLGLSGIFSQGCGGDDSAPPVGTAGSGGTGGSSGGSAGTGGGGTGGTTAGTAGKAAGDSGMPDVDYKPICRMNTPDSGNACLDSCICDQCSAEAVACFSRPACRALIDCANAMGCSETVCVAMKCQTQFAMANNTDIAAASAFGACYFGKCGPMCSPSDAGDAGKSDVTSDVKSDTTTSDAPAPTDSTTSDALTVDVPTIDVLVPEAGGD